jgi:hypothetical protein
MAVEVIPSVEVRKKLTPDDVWKMIKRGELDTHARWFELIEGEMVDVPPSEPADSETGLDVAAELRRFAKKVEGRAFGADGGFLVGQIGNNCVRQTPLTLALRELSSSTASLGRTAHPT